MDPGYDFSHFQVTLPPTKLPPMSNVTSPLRRINCESMADDFYSNLIDWSGDKIFYTVEDTIYSYNFFTEATTKLFQSEMNPVCSIKCIKQLDVLVVGSSSGIITFIDLNTLKSSKYLYHRGRISVLEAFENKVITGSRDRKSKILDIRTKVPQKTYSFHYQEVCGTSLNSEQKYLATGGNDNKIFVIDLRKDSEPLLRLEDHKAAVKALSWSPYYTSRFVSGGGTADKTMKLWDIHSQCTLQRSINYESQICNLRWLSNNKILSTFGYSNDDIKLLKDFKVEKRFSGHKNRVIHFAVDDNEEFFVSGSGDSTIRIWEIESKRGLEDIKIR